MEDENFDTVPSYYRHSITGFGPITAPDQRNLFALFNGGNLSNADRLGFRFASVKLKRKRMDCDPSVACDTRESDSPLSPNFRFFQSRVNLVDRTGSFHWTPDVPYSKSTLVSLNDNTLILILNNQGNYIPFHSVCAEQGMVSSHFRILDIRFSASNFVIA